LAAPSGKAERRGTKQSPVIIPDLKIRAVHKSSRLKPTDCRNCVIGFNRFVIYNLPLFLNSGMKKVL
jgi:hypothetical protein